MRVFVALNIPSRERDRIFRATRRLREEGLPVRWVDPGLYHITLKFVGALHPDRVEGVRGVLDRVSARTSRFPLRLSGIGAFPSLRQPTVIWLAVDPTAPLRCLKHDVEWGLAENGFPRETRAFHPHVTLGRAEREGGPGAFRRMDELTAALDYEGAFEPRSLDLMSSELARQGPHYKILSTSALKDGG